MTATQYSQLRRKRWLSEGLTSKGTERVNKRHPELSGLKERAYHLAYIRKQRLHEKAEKIRLLT